MHTKAEGIILQNIKYADKKHIVKAFTREQGLVSFMAIPGHSPSSKIRKAAIAPLAISELNYSFRPNKDIQNLSEANVKFVLDNISRDLGKMSISLFVNEVLIKTLKEQGAHEELFDFVKQFIVELNEVKENYANYHLKFLLGLTRFLGFEPMNNYSETEKYFDCREGKFSPLALSFPIGLSESQSQLLYQYLKSESQNFPATKTDRNELAECFIAFYKMHVAGFSGLKTTDVLKELFA